MPLETVWQVCAGAIGKNFPAFLGGKVWFN